MDATAEQLKNIHAATGIIVCLLHMQAACHQHNLAVCQHSNACDEADNDVRLIETSQSLPALCELAFSCMLCTFAILTAGVGRIRCLCPEMQARSACRADNDH